MSPNSNLKFPIERHTSLHNIISPLTIMPNHEYQCSWLKVRNALLDLKVNILRNCVTFQMVQREDSEVRPNRILILNWPHLTSQWPSAKHLLWKSSWFFKNLLSQNQSTYMKGINVMKELNWVETQYTYIFVPSSHSSKLNKTDERPGHQKPHLSLFLTRYFSTKSSL